MTTTPTCYNVGNGAVALSECSWDQVDAAYMLQNNKPPVWNQFTPQNVASVPVAYNECQFESSGSQSWSNGSTVGIQIPQSPGCSKKPGAVKKPKRIRTAFTTEQVMALEGEYARNRYLDRLRRLELAELLRLNERALKIWFQNRRMKEKKDREDSEATSTSESPEFHEHQYLPATSYPPAMPAPCPPSSMPSYVPPAMPSYVPSALPASWLPPAMPESYYSHLVSMSCQATESDMALALSGDQQTFQSSETECVELAPEVSLPESGRHEPTPSASSEEKDWELTRLLSALYGD